MARLCGVLGGLAVLVGGCMPGGLLITPVSAKRDLVEETLVSEGSLAGNKIALLDVEGIILNAEQPKLLGEGEHPVARLLEQLDKARGDPSVKAVLLRINSPGGSVTASELMYQEIVDFRRRTGKPVVAVLMDVAASGGYYVACACDKIVAQRSTVTGSIGVLMQLLDLSGTMRKIGLEAPAITSGLNKDAGAPFKPLTPDQRAIFQTIVDQMFESFVDVVAAGRPKLTREQILKLADGRVYSAPQALEAGLIDEIGTLRETIGDLKQELGLQRIRLVAYRRPLGYRPNYYARAEPPATGGTQMNLINVNASSWWLPPTPQFLYLWAPGG
ncbi:MAG: signal peptide peptidase SppA [Planctomycetota bacterium]